jgi:hypothetical protein
MAKYAFLIMVNPVRGQDEALNAWLDGTHIPEVLKTPGFNSCQRYELAPEESANPKAKHRYMHIYDVESDDLGKTKEAMKAAAASHSPRSPALDPDSVFAVFYKTR